MSGSQSEQLKSVTALVRKHRQGTLVTTVVIVQRIAFESRCKLPIETILSFFDPDPAMDIIPLLESIALPTLVAHGGEDQLISYATSEFIASRIPEAQLYITARCSQPRTNFAKCFAISFARDARREHLEDRWQRETKTQRQWLRGQASAEGGLRAELTPCT